MFETPEQWEAEARVKGSKKTKHKPMTENRSFEEWWNNSEHNCGNSGFVQGVAHEAAKSAYAAGQRQGMNMAAEIALEDSCCSEGCDDQACKAFQLIAERIRKELSHE